MKKKFRQKEKAEKLELTEENADKKLNWFPGHMLQAMKKIKEKLKSVNILIEVRDARAPLLTANHDFTQEFKDKSSLILLNKVNLADKENTKKWENYFQAKNIDFLFVNILDKSTLNYIIKYARKIVFDKHKESNPDTNPAETLRMMIIGLPNTGKSTLINSLAKRDATRVADRPGQTKQQIWIKATEQLEILDTPGIMPVNIDEYDDSLALAAIHAIPETIYDLEDTALYIFQRLIASNSKALAQHYKVDLNDENLMDKIALSRGCIKSKNQIDYDRLYKLIINDFRKGLLGNISFESPHAL